MSDWLFVMYWLMYWLLAWAVLEMYVWLIVYDVLIDVLIACLGCARDVCLIDFLWCIDALITLHDVLMEWRHLMMDSLRWTSPMFTSLCFYLIVVIPFGEHDHGIDDSQVNLSYVCLIMLSCYYVIMLSWNWWFSGESLLCLSILFSAPVRDRVPQSPLP